MGTHDGHRERMRERFRQYGGESFEKHELLEMLLYYAYPRTDTNERAHKLLDAFDGSFTKLITSDPENIEKQSGISSNAAIMFSLIGEIYKRIAIEKWDKNVCIKNTAYAGEYAKSYLTNLDIEKMYVVCLDNALKVIKCVEASKGTVNSVFLEKRKLIEIAVTNKASKIILMHNHPSGIIRPSYEDISFTIECINALKVIDIEFVDHIIVAGDNYFSMKDNNMLPKKEMGKNEWKKIN